MAVRNKREDLLGEHPGKLASAMPILLLVTLSWPTTRTEAASAWDHPPEGGQCSWRKCHCLLLISLACHPSGWLELDPSFLPFPFCWSAPLRQAPSKLFNDPSPEKMKWWHFREMALCLPEGVLCTHPPCTQAKCWDKRPAEPEDQTQLARPRGSAHYGSRVLGSQSQTAQHSHPRSAEGPGGISSRTWGLTYLLPNAVPVNDPHKAKNSKQSLTL